MKRVCIVTPGYLVSSPRTVKEADALSRAGHSVCVVHGSGNLESLRRDDERLVAGRPWRSKGVGWSPFRPAEKMTYRRTKLRHFLARTLPGFAAPIGLLAEYGEGRIFGELVAAAASEPADLYIGHYPDGLAAAARAARRNGALYGYDIEDLHAEEQKNDAPGRRKSRRIETIERRYLPGASHVTAVSDLVADRISARYGVPRPVPVYNAFSLDERRRADGRTKDRRGDSLSLYWFSQTVGTDRGLEDVIRAAGKVGNVQLHVRGSIAADVRASLEKLAAETGFTSLFFHELVHPDELFSRAREHDVGLAVEPALTESRRLTVTNKLFFYFLAGLAVAATDTPGQRFVLDSAPGAGFVYAPGDVDALARALASLDPGKLARMKSASWSAAEKWNAETETGKIVRSVERCLR